MNIAFVQLVTEYLNNRNESNRLKIICWLNDNGTGTKLADACAPADAHFGGMMSSVWVPMSYAKKFGVNHNHLPYEIYERLGNYVQEELNKPFDAIIATKWYSSERGAWEALYVACGMKD